MALEMTGAQSKHPLVYALHSGELYGTERMALYTASGLSDQFAPIFLAPAGPLLTAARAQGFGTFEFSGIRQLSAHIRRLLAKNQALAFLATGVVHSALCLAWNVLYRRRISHLHLVHGGACEKLSYGRKKLLNGRALTFVAVSEYVRQRLIANGVRADQVKVIENFLPDTQVENAPRRPPFCPDSRKCGKLTRVIVISRLDPEKQVGLLLNALERDALERDAVEQAPHLQCIEVRIFGTGWEFDALRRRSEQANLRVTFEGFSANVSQALAASDLMVHLCPVEPFGLVILEAFAAGVPVLVPDSGGAASLVENGRSGFHFRAGNAADLRQRLSECLTTASDSLNAVVAEGRGLLKTRFAASQGVAGYRTLLLQDLRLKDAA